MCDYDYALLVLYVIDIMCYFGLRMILIMRELYYVWFVLYVIVIMCDW